MDDRSGVSFCSLGDQKGDFWLCLLGLFMVVSVSCAAVGVPVSRPCQTRDSSGSQGMNLCHRH